MACLIIDSKYFFFFIRRFYLKVFFLDEESREKSFTLMVVSFYGMELSWTSNYFASTISSIRCSFWFSSSFISIVSRFWICSRSVYSIFLFGFLIDELLYKKSIFWWNRLTLTDFFLSKSLNSSGDFFKFWRLFILFIISFLLIISLCFSTWSRFSVWVSKSSFRLCRPILEFYSEVSELYFWV